MTRVNFAAAPASLPPKDYGLLHFPGHSQTPVPALTSDRWRPSAKGIPVVSYNTGCHDPQKTPQDEVVELPMFQRVIAGSADAPIIGCQESGPALVKRLQALAKKTGNFSVFAEQTSSTQYNITVIPKRFKVMSHENHYYKGRVAQFFSSLAGLIFHGKTPDWGQVFEHRGYQRFALQDSTTGQRLTFINTHLSGWAPMRLRQGAQLAAGARRAEKSGPVMVVGDFNANSLASATQKAPDTLELWREMAPAKLQDLFPVPKSGGDQMLGYGLQAHNVHMYAGNQISLPGHPDAESMSEHDPLEMNVTLG